MRSPAKKGQASDPYSFARLARSEAPALRELAAAEGVSGSYVTRVVRPAFLAPDITHVTLEGTAPVELTAKRLSGAREPPSTGEASAGGSASASL